MARLSSPHPAAPHPAAPIRIAPPPTPRRPADLPVLRSRHTVWADRGQFLQIGPGSEHARICWAGVSRFGGVALRARAFCIWMQMRGSCEVRCEEGQFRLHPGDWIALDADSNPELLGGASGLTIGLILPYDLLPPTQDHCLFVGKGTMPLPSRRIAMRLWRRAAAQCEDGDDACLQRTLRPLLVHLAAMQERFVADLGRCPGHSRSRRRRVFNRLQRAWLTLEGNTHRIVRMSELAQVTHYSVWYVSKTFHELYGESVQSASARLRIERAQELLAHTALDITEIAEACGFDNACSFARAFRTRSRTTASDYRLHCTDAPPAVGHASGGGYGFGVLPHPPSRGGRESRVASA